MAVINNNIQSIYALDFFQYEYDYSLIDSSIIDNAQNTFDVGLTLLYLHYIWGAIGFMIILGVAFDIYNLLYHKPGKMSVQDSSGNLLEPSFVFTCPCI
jgi:hypothetical protein